MKRRALLALSLPAALLGTGCAEDPSQSYLWGVGDPIRGTALNATRMLGDTSRWDGDPAGAAIAAAQLEFLARSFREDPIWSVRASTATVQELQQAVLQMREALGISPTAPNAVIEQLLRQAGEALRAGSQARALAALSGPNFIVPPQEVLRRLGSLPRLNRVSAAAGMAGNDAFRRPR
nr:hypothetical protein [uncultured Roseococcus sp.]